MRWHWERLAALAGIGAVVLWVVGLVIQGESPERDDKTPVAFGAEVLSRYHDDTDKILVGGFIFQLGVLFFLIFLVALRARLGEVEGPNGFLTLLASGAGIALAVFMLAAPGGDMAGAINDDELTPGSALVFNNIGDAFFIGAELSAALFVGATALLIVRRRALPVLLGWISFLLVLLLLIPPIGWAGVVFGLPIWLIVTSVLLYLSAPGRQVADVSAG
jgi:hypothetical protein